MSILDGNLISNLSDKGIRSTLYIQSDLAVHAFLSLWRKGTFVQNQGSVLDNLKSCYILKPGKSPFAFYCGNMLAVILVWVFLKKIEKERDKSKPFNICKKYWLENSVLLEVTVFYLTILRDTGERTESEELYFYLCLPHICAPVSFWFCSACKHYICWENWFHFASQFIFLVH